MTERSSGSFKYVKPLNKNKVDVSLVKISSKNMTASMNLKVVDSYDPTKTVSIKATSRDMQLIFEYDSRG